MHTTYRKERILINMPNGSSFAEDEKKIDRTVDGSNVLVLVKAFNKTDTPSLSLELSVGGTTIEDPMSIDFYDGKTGNLVTERALPINYDGGGTIKATLRSEAGPITATQEGKVEIVFLIKKSC